MVLRILRYRSNVSFLFVINQPRTATTTVVWKPHRIQTRSTILCAIGNKFSKSIIVLDSLNLSRYYRRSFGVSGAKDTKLITLLWIFCRPVLVAWSALALRIPFSSSYFLVSRTDTQVVECYQGIGFYCYWIRFNYIDVILSIFITCIITTNNNVFHRKTQFFVIHFSMKF